MTTFITISGPVSSGKTPYATKIQKLLIKKEKSAIVIDHTLYESNKKIDQKIEECKNRCVELGFDYGILIIGTSHEKPFTIKIEGESISSSMQLFNDLF